MISTQWFSGDGIAECRAIRRAVFVREQGVPSEDEYDELDKTARHVLARVDGEPAGTGRLAVVDGRCLLGRICVLKQHRGAGIGDLITRLLIRKASSLGFAEQYVHAQSRARAFYEKLGFEAFGEPFFEAGLEHVNMVHKGGVTGGCG
jgi:predicted GNAT family N-acyltransferase